MMADSGWSIKMNLNNIEHDRQLGKRKYYLSSYVHEAFISAVSLLNDFVKILVGFGIFNRVIFNDLGSGSYGKNSIS